MNTSRRLPSVSSTRRRRPALESLARMALEKSFVVAILPPCTWVITISGSSPLSAASLPGATRVITTPRVDDLEARARQLVEEGRATILADIEDLGVDPATCAPALDAILGPPSTALVDRMDERRSRIADLLADLHELTGSPQARAAPQLERVLGEEYALASEAEADFASFARIVRMALEESGEQLGR